MATYIKRGDWRYLESQCVTCGIEKLIRVDKIKAGIHTHCKKCAMKLRPSSVYARGKSAPNYKHGKTNSDLHKRWMWIHNRVKDPAKRKYYLDKGITVCQEWQEFEKFETWSISNGYEPGLTIDRIDNSGNYEPSNCRWVTHKVNCQNRG